MSNGLVAPVLSQVSYPGSLIIANFTYEDPAWSTFQIALFEGSNPTPTQIAPCGALSGQLINPQMNTTSVWWVKIAATDGGTPGPYSNTIAVVVGPPQNITVATDEAALMVTWSPPAGPTVAYGAVLSLSAGQAAFNASLNGSPGVYRPPGGFNPNLSYEVQLGGMTTTNSFGPYSARLPVIQSTPVLSEVTYIITGASASTIIANSSTIDQTYVLGLYLFADGRLYASAIAGAPGAIVELPLTELLDPAFTWTVSIAFTNAAGTTRGPRTQGVALVVEPVSIDTVAYDGANITASWKNGVGSPHPTGGYVEINDGATTVASASTLGTSISIAHQLTTGTKYKLKTDGQRGVALGPASTTVNVLTWLPSPTLVTYDGENIGVTWSAIGDTDVTGMNVALLNAGTAVQTQPGGNLATTIPAALAPTGTYDIALQTTGDRTIGPFGTSVPVISAVPRVTGATYSTSGSTSSIDVKWNAADISNAHGITGYSVQLYENGAPLGAAVPVSGGATDQTTVSIDSLLDIAKAHTITVQATGTKSSGPFSAPSPVITAAPQFTSIAGNGTSFTATWTTIGQDGVTGYKISIGGTHYTTSLNSITFTYSGDTNPAISIVARGAAAEGPATSTTLLNSSVDVKSTSYDGSMLKATWLASTAPPAYVLEVLEGSNVIASLTSTDLKATLAVALSTSETYSAAVRPASADGVVIGPRSIAATIVVKTPTISSIGYDGTNVTGTVTAPSGVSLDTTTLNVQLYANGIAVGDSVSASGGSFTIPATGTAGSALSVRAELTGTKSSVAITAPLSIDYPVLTATPVIDSALFSFSRGTTWNISATWSLPDADPSAGTFTVVLTQNSVALQTWTITGNSLSDSVASVDATKNLTLTVTAKGNYGTGPASAAATFVPTTISAVSSVVDGNRVTATWTDADGTSFTAHRLRLVQQAAAAWVTIAEGQSISGTTAFVEVPSALIETDAVYAITIDAAVGIAWTASNSVTDIVVQTPYITSARTLTKDSMHVAWDAPSSPSGITGYQPVMIWEGGELALDAVDGTLLEANIGIPSLVPNNSWVTIGAIKGNANGPLSTSMAFVVDVPSGVAVAYDGTNISASWNAAEDNRVSAYRVTFTASGSDPVSETVSTPSWSKAFTPTAGQTATVSVGLVAGVSRGVETAALDAILNAPSITKAAFSGSQLTLTWSGVGDTAATAYVINVMSGGSVIAEYTSGGTTATIPFAASADTMQIRAIGSSTSGPLSTGFTPISATPNVTSIAFDASDGSLNMAWDPITGAGRYNVVFRSANSIITQSNPTTNSLKILPADLPAAGIYGVTVQAFAAAANDDVSGPISAPLPAVIVPPPDVKIAYDGRNARVTWAPLASPAITGYNVSILNGATVVTSQITTNPAAVIALAYASTNDYDVVVQALTSAGSGQASAKSKLFQAGWYPSTATDKASYIQPANNAAMTKYDIVVYLPNIFTTYVSSDLPDIPPFKIETANAPFSYKLTIAATSDAWNFSADSIRSGIVTAYGDLLTALVAKNVTPLGWRVVQDAISRAMPQTFAETLYYGYAFVPGDGYVDLKPGMVLRADFESYQYLGPDQTVSEYVDGFVSASSAFYDVGSYVTAGDVWLNGFDAFLSLVTQSGSTVPAPQTSGTTSSGGGGIVDLYFAQFRKPYVRLVYPPTILGDRTAEARVAFNVAVLAANDYPTLNTATGYLRDAQPLPSGVAATYLRGRTMISACIRVWLDGQPLIVPVGSSAGNVLEQMGRRPPITIPQQGAPGIPLSGISLERSIGYAATDPSGYSVSKAIPIRLDWNLGMAYSASTDWLNIPLLPGDRIVTRGDE